MKIVIKSPKMKNILSLIILLNTITSISQEKNEIYVKMDKEKDKELYILKKRNQNLQIKIIYFEKRNNGFKKNKEKNNNEIVIVESLPNEYFYEFNSFGLPVKVSNINKFNYYSIEEVSKHKVWNKKPPHSIVFIEKLNNCNYNLWKMYPTINE